MYRRVRRGLWPRMEDQTIPETWALIPILAVGILGFVIALGYAIQAWNTWEAKRNRTKQARAHLAQNHLEIQTGLLAERVRQGYISERVRVLLRWIDHEEPLLKGEDAGLLLGVQEATLRELDQANGR